MLEERSLAARAGRVTQQLAILKNALHLIRDDATDEASASTMQLSDRWRRRLCYEMRSLV